MTFEFAATVTLRSPPALGPPAAAADDRQPRVLYETALEELVAARRALDASRAEAAALRAELATGGQCIAAAAAPRRRPGGSALEGHGAAGGVAAAARGGVPQCGEPAVGAAADAVGSIGNARLLPQRPPAEGHRD